MATPEDYIGKRFGAFEIGPIIGEGLESEVYLCRHLINDRTYALKLFVDDDFLWDAEPLLPPPNAYRVQIPLDKVHTVAKASGGYQRLSPNYLMVFAQNRYVRPLTVLVKAKGAWTFEDLLRYGPKAISMLNNIHLYNNAAYAMLTDLLNVTDNEVGNWETKWGRLRGGNHLTSFLQSHAHNLKNPQLFDMISHTPTGNVEFAENHLLWLAEACISNDLSADSLHSTLMCPFFRLNIATDEVLQLIDLQLALSSSEQYVSNDMDRTMKWIDVIVGRLFAEPFDPTQNPENFERLDDSIPRVSHRAVILMEHIEQPLIGTRWGLNE